MKNFMVRVLVLVLAFVTGSYAQTTVSTGSIQGTITDPTGAAIAAAQVTITGKATGQVLRSTTSSTGTYSSGALIPGEYSVRVEAQGFRALELLLTVQVGVTTAGNGQLEIGSTGEVVEVQASAVNIDTSQAIVQGVMTSQQIDNLPINGRNFLDLAQLEPGVQIQDGTNFDPTKVGYSSISFGGRFGRTARISVDGVDVSDETVGTTTGDIPSSGIQEFQLSQSNLDLSNDLTSSGAVNVITRSGTNDYHGEAYYYIRDSRWGADIPHPVGLPAPYQRNQFGGRFGGKIIKDKLFFFTDYERTKQDSFVPVQYASPFDSFSGGFGSPFRENLPMARVDWQPTSNLRLFYRFNYYNTLAEATFFSSSLQVYKSKNYTRGHTVGADFNTGEFTHSIRFQWLKFENDIGDAVLGTGLPLANLGLNLNVINGPQTGPNLLAPQATAQLNRQIKYDGARPLHSHMLRYGVSYNRIVVGGFASFFKLAPQVQTNFAPSDATSAATGPYPGGAGNPLNYPVDLVILGNGQGYSTENPALGWPAGRLGPDNRFAFYVGDTWKIRKNLTLNYGLRYVRDTGRTDSDLPGFPQLDALIPGTGGAVNQPNKNFAPQAGIAWDPTGSGKTVIRAGAGLFYENVIFNNVLFDRPLRLPNGAYLQYPLACYFGQALPVTVPGGSTITVPSELCNETVGGAASGLAAFQQQYQALNPFSLNNPNPNYLVNDLNSGVNLPLGLFAPGYKTPRSVQMNVGVQRELFRGTVLTVDYVRNITTHSLLGIDMNHVGDVKYFNKSAAQGAIAATLSSFGATTIDQAIAKGATMADFAGKGLTSPSLDFGGACPFSYGCAFPGINPAAPGLTELQPIGRSVYNGLDVKLRQEINTNWKSMRHANLQVAYSLSRFVNPGGSNPSTPGNNDQDFVISAVDNEHPLSFMGPSLLDRTHQFSAGGFFDFPLGFRGSTIMHFYSGLPVTPVVPNTGIGAGEIFRTDFTGDGTVQDLLPGSKMGSFNRDYGVGGLTSAINAYNQSIANQPTPAGQVLVNAGLFTVAQLQALGGVAPTITAPPNGEVGVGGLRSVDLSLSWMHKFGERFEVEPKVSFFNVFNFANFDLPPNVIGGLLNGSAGSINGTTQADRITNRVGLGTGVFALGAPRAIEFGIRLAF
jgi:hypothetical protein